VGSLWPLTEGLHGLHQLEGEDLVPGQLLQHARHLIVPRAHHVAPVDALDVVAHGDHLHAVHHAVVLDALRRNQSQIRLYLYSASHTHKRNSQVLNIKMELKVGQRNEQNMKVNEYINTVKLRIR